MSREIASPAGVAMPEWCRSRPESRDSAFAASDRSDFDYDEVDVEEDREGASWDEDGARDLDGLLAAFLAMEQRRIRRFQNGRVSRRGILGASKDMLYVAIVLLVAVHVMHWRWAAIAHARWVPVLLSVTIAVVSIAHAYIVPENIVAEMGGATMRCFILWLVWEYRPPLRGQTDEYCHWFNKPAEFRVATPNDYDWFAVNFPRLDGKLAVPCYWFNELIVVIVFGTLSFVMIVLYLVMTFGVRWAAVTNFGGCGTSCWWRVRRIPDSGKFSYRPGGLLSCARAEFGYEGERDADGAPHGRGMWYDNSFHGECLQGHWEHGRPCGSFRSREHGTGAQFCQRVIGYATSRLDCPAEDLSRKWNLPQKGKRMRFGVAQVEVSLAGGFFPFLPSVESSQELTSMTELVKSLREQGEQALDKSENLRVLRLVVAKGDETRRVAPTFGRLGTRTMCVPFTYAIGDSVGYVDEAALGEARALVDSAPEALVFMHGYNSDLASACGRLAQLLSLGNMARNIVPFVFSYSAGSAFTYFAVRKHMPEYSDDLQAFLGTLGQHFKQVHIVCHSCGAEFFFKNVDSIIACFAPSRHRAAEERLLSASRADARPQLLTLTLLNPDVLVETVKMHLAAVMFVTEHFTVYCDRDDKALFYTQVLQNMLPPRVTRSERSPGAKAKVLGRKVQALSLRMLLNDYQERGLSMEDLRRIDVIDCSSIEQNIHTLRHNYYMLNTQMVEDVCDLIGRRLRAQQRSRLLHVEGNVYNFLCPPGFYTPD